MIDSARASISKTPSEVLQQQLSSSTRHAWEASAFNGLFESHLHTSVAPTDGGRPDRLPDAGVNSDDVSSWPGESGEPAAAGFSAAAGHVALKGADEPRTGAETEVDPEWNVAAGKQEVAGDLQEWVPADDSDELVPSTSVSILADQGSSEPPPVSMTVCSGQEATELYVRIAGMDAESALAFAKSAEQVLQAQRLSLGRVKLNGQLVWDEGAGVDQPRFRA